MEHEPTLEEVQKEYHGTLKSYLLGFFYCLCLTLASFGLVITKALSLRNLVYALVALALIQAIIQLRFFLKLGHERKPHWQTMIFAFLVLILLIIAGGSLWVMFDLNNRLMPPM
ncbi:MAG TPA: cytochrome o ubiquinol oxidase subunit IV [Chlamydiales bacterium]|nr:cytochrome o ubiquinol oxidase subunit IV [Chlamydiales bacterium]